MKLETLLGHVTWVSIKHSSSKAMAALMLMFHLLPSMKPGQEWACIVAMDRELAEHKIVDTCVIIASAKRQHAPVE
jgi:hypothetical protein